MYGIEDYEGIDELSLNQDLEGQEGLSLEELDSVQEALETGNTDFIAARIDEITSEGGTPKAIDSNEDIAEMLEEAGVEIDSIYLEAPSDLEQVEQAAESIRDIEGASFNEWQGLSKEEKVEVLQEIENKVAEIAHRPPCEVRAESLGEGYFGGYHPATNSIVLNSDYLEGQDVYEEYNCYTESMDTILHEGRHAYQQYNMNGREVHPSQGDIANWRDNIEEWGYQNGESPLQIEGLDAASTAKLNDLGAKLYEMQPMETDARKFAKDVLESLSIKK